MRPVAHMELRSGERARRRRMSPCTCTQGSACNEINTIPDLWNVVVLTSHFQPKRRPRADCQASERCSAATAHLQHQQRERRACRQRVYDKLASAFPPFQSSAQYRRAAPRAGWRCKARITRALCRRHHHSSLRALVIVACLCTACFARATV